MVFIVLYEHYLNDRDVNVIAVYSDEERAKEKVRAVKNTLGFRDECWYVPKKVIS